MKSKKQHDYIKFFKPSMIVALVLVIVSIVTLALFGFNKGFDFTGGTQLVVQFELTDLDIENQEDCETASAEIKTILREHSVTINSFQTQGDYASKSFVITFQNSNGDDVNAIRVAINQKYNTSGEFADLVAHNNAEDIIDKPTDITKQTTHIDGLIEQGTLLTTIAAVLFALAVLIVYACFRLTIAGALSMLFSTMLGVVISLCLVVLSRIQINTYIFANMGLVALTNIFASSDLLFTIKDLDKDKTYSDYTTYDLSNLAVSKTFRKNLIIYVMSFVLAILVGALSFTNVLHVALVAFAGLVVTFAVSTFITPALYALLNQKRVKYPVNSTQNNQDKNAEVIEIKE